MTPIDVTSPDTLTLTEACALLPRGRNGSRPHLSTLVRWITHGAPAPDGRLVRLAAARCGGKWVTSRAALNEFVAVLTPRPEGGPRLAPRTSPQRRRASARAEKELEKRGL
jgi:hypothetical protein